MHIIHVKYYVRRIFYYLVNQFKNIKESNKFQNIFQILRKNKNCNNLNYNNSLSLGIEKGYNNSMIIKKPKINLINHYKNDILIESIDKGINLENDEGRNNEFRKKELPDDMQNQYIEINNPSKIDFLKGKQSKKNENKIWAIRIGYY